MVNFETPTHTTAQAQPTAPFQNKADRKPGNRRTEPSKRSLLRRIRLKIGGKVADLFTW
jgi:hypothetical protein